nr:MAG TPA: hypothetical protein [Caudoviricetes sp.]
MEQNNNDNIAIAVVALARVAYTVILGLLTGWLLNVKGFDHGFWWGALSAIMILWTAKKAIEAITFITLALTLKDD